jgi:hypothetical protein
MNDYNLATMCFEDCSATQAPEAGLIGGFRIAADNARHRDTDPR